MGRFRCAIEKACLLLTCWLHIRSGAIDEHPHRFFVPFVKKRDVHFERRIEGEDEIEIAIDSAIL